VCQIVHCLTAIEHGVDILNRVVVLMSGPTAVHILQDCDTILASILQHEGSMLLMLFIQAWAQERCLTHLSIK